jgi:hypothetical protein
MTSANFTPTFDSWAAYPQAVAARQAFVSGDWPGFRARYDAAAGWRERWTIMGVTYGLDGSEHFLKSVIERDPDDLVATTMYGTRLVHIGWSIRTAQRARHVSPEQFEAFHRYLRDAEEVLSWVCAQDPGFVPAWLERLNVARGLGLGQSEARRRYEHVIQLDPHNLDAQTILLQQLCPKWGGTFATMHAFAAENAAAAPAGAHNAALVVDAHMEHWLDLESGKDAKYMHSDAVRAEIVAAGERSVLHPDFDRGVGWVYPMSMFALGYVMVKEWSLAKRCFLALGPYADDWCWQYLGDPAEEFAKWRTQALRRG